MGFPKLATQTDSVSDARLALVTQFIPSGARILDVDAASLTRHLPCGCMYRSAKREVVTAETAAKYDLIVMLAPLQTQTCAELFLGELAKAERPLLISYRNDDRLSFHSLVRLIGRNGFRVETSAAASHRR